MTERIQRGKPDYSIVIPVYFNEGCLLKLMNTIKDDVIQQNRHLTCEIIFVDDGSRDGSFDELIRIHKENPEIVKVIKFTRNFGQVYALLAGISHAEGECVVLMSADGQDPPGLINEMLSAYYSEGYETVICTRTERDESIYRIITSKIFYALIRYLMFPNMPKGGFDYILLGPRAKEIFMRNVDSHPFIQGQILWPGIKTKYIEYQRRKRIAGKTRWTFGKKLTYLIDGILSYSFGPIRLCSFMGISLAILGFIYAVAIFLSRAIFGNPVKGWAPLMIVVLVIGGFQLLMLGIVGEYIWRILAQVRNRDPYVIDTVYDKRTGKERD